MKTQQTITIGNVEVPRGDFNNKFILISHKDTEGNLVYSVICRPVGFHYEIVSVIRKAGIDFKVHGGGKLSKLGSDLNAYGKSVDYGVCDKEIANYILSDYASQNNLSFTNSLETQLY